jgi:uncharacterized SAM-binding protein YcdF (DUF218 family)
VKRIFRASALILAVTVVLLLIFHSAVLAALGHFLVKAGPPEKADIIIVLAGDGFGHRILTAGELVKQGYASKAMISGPDGNYGVYECDLAIPFAVRAGDPESLFTHFEHHGRSTVEEAEFIVKALRESGVKRVILVTSNFHTRRAGNIFRRTAPEIRFFVVAAPDQNFKPDDWWHTRESSKTFAMEWMKTVADWLR